MPQVRATWIFKEVWDWLKAADERILLLEGGTRSSKTWSILTALIIVAKEERCVIDVFRAEGTTCRRTVLKDFVEILEGMNRYDPSAHHKTNATYTFPNGSLVRFCGADSAQKLRGSERHHLYLNEANEFSREHWKQLRYRTTGQVIMDWNPSFDVSQTFIGDAKQDPQIEFTEIRSTYKDNPFLNARQIQAIESAIPVYREQDGTLVEDRDLEYQGDGTLVRGSPTDWAIYGLGRYRRSPLLLFPHFEEKRFVIEQPDAYGLDFGYTAPSALVQIQIDPSDEFKDRLRVDQLLYQKGLTSRQLVQAFERLDVSKDVPMYCDSAEPSKIQTLQNAGYDAKKTEKDTSGSIDAVQNHRLQIQGSDLINEVRSYQRVAPHSDAPDPQCTDHLVDAMRYAVLTHTLQDTDGSLSDAFAILNT